MNTPNTQITTFLLAAAIALPTAASAGSIAHDDQIARVSVQVVDLNLDHPKGLETLYGRLQRASRQVCGSQFVADTRSARRSQHNRDCYDSGFVVLSRNKTSCFRYRLSRSSFTSSRSRPTS